MGITREDIGTHSFRKGSGTFVSSFPGGPSDHSVEVRMEHATGVKKIYIKQG